MSSRISGSSGSVDVQSDELAIQDIADVQHREAWIDRILGTSTVVVHSRNHRRAPLVLPHVRRGAQLAALLDLIVG